MEFQSGHTYTCPGCGKEMKIMTHRFRPPKNSENHKWELVEYLVLNGFKYQRIYEKIEEKGKTTYLKQVAYPENLKEAKIFVEKYRDQAIR